MSQQTSFSIYNSSDSDMEVIHEPEGFVYTLPIREEIVIVADSCLNSVQIKISSEENKIVVAILDEKSLYSVMYKGEDVFKKYL
ncbi:hypothetical protein HF329_05605 [Chitinophaga oryzae]|uniref:Uncharacterized protein n=1 Tax=Chitinophaga oryzae TaxID=2725414 RepID=A0AAE6ZD69_9BACT|nr:hypothetical protein [Chitinophaga oryzae]QJB30801.1 hypothetical protein HF329_05605 [Chitinophaga oryzae]